MGDGLSAWQVLALVGIVLAIVEVFTTSFVLLPAGLAFLATAGWSLVFHGLLTQLGILAAHLFLTYMIFQRWIWPNLKKGAPKSAASGMIGRIATVTEEISGTGDLGYVQLYGDSWRAVASERFEVGARVKIIALDGNKVVVGPEHS